MTRELRDVIKKYKSNFHGGRDGLPPLHDAAIPSIGVVVDLVNPPVTPPIDGASPTFVNPPIASPFGGANPAFVNPPHAG